MQSTCQVLSVGVGEAWWPRFLRTKIDWDEDLTEKSVGTEGGYQNDAKSFLLVGKPPDTIHPFAAAPCGCF